MLSFVLFILSACFVVGLDLLLQYDLRTSLKNLLTPFRFSTGPEYVFMSVIVLYVFVKPLVLNLLKKK